MEYKESSQKQTKWKSNQYYDYSAQEISKTSMKTQSIIKNHVQVHNPHGQIISTSTFKQQNSYSTVNCKERLCLFLDFIFIKNTRYPFQLLKQFFLFGSDDSESDFSIQVESKHKYMVFQMEMAQENIKSVLIRAKQRAVLESFTELKNQFIRKQNIYQVYHQRENVQTIVTSIVNLLKNQNQKLISEVFSCLYENYQKNNFHKVNISKIQTISNSAVSKDLENDIKGFLFQEKIQEYYQEEHLEKIEEINMHKKNMITLSKKRSLSDINSPKFEKGKHQEIIIQTQVKKQQEFETPQRNGALESQQIYVIRSSSHKERTKKKKPFDYIKIPVISENIKIIEIDSKRSSKKRVSQFSMHESYEERNCLDCKYCTSMRWMKETMKSVRQSSTRMFMSENSSSYIQKE